MRLRLLPRPFPLVLWMRLHLLAARTAPRAPRSSPPAHQKECEVALRVLAIWPHGAEVIVADV